VRRNIDRDTRCSALQMTKIAFPIVPGSIEVSSGGNFKRSTRGSASSEAPVAFPLAPGFIEISVRGNFDLHAGSANISISAVAFPFLPCEIRKMGIVRNLDSGAEIIALAVAAVALPPLSAKGEKGVLGYFDVHTFLFIRESISMVAFPAGAIVFDVSMVRRRSQGLLLCRSQPRPEEQHARREQECPRPAPGFRDARPCFAVPMMLHITPYSIPIGA
jgi:hypothetical protein